ncbi:MAG: hypothetical protein EOM14_13165, partial [Clostridia bacterium]|nr:hypothetical protein [Clostridia bacterium]
MHRGKLVAPIIVGALLIAWFCFWLALCFSMPELSLPVKLAGAIIPLALIGVTVFVMIQRIK